MESFEDFHKILSSVLGNDINYYFVKFYEYLDDVFEDRKVDMDFDSKYDNLKVYKKNISNILDVASLGLRTIGVPKNKFEGDLAKFLDNIKDKDATLDTYGEVFNQNIKPIIESFLIGIIVEYLTGEDKNGISNLDLFDLIPRGFVDRLDDFETNYMNEEIKKLLKGKDFKSETLSVITKLDTLVIPPVEKKPAELEKPKSKPAKKKIEKPKKKPVEPPSKVGVDEMDILQQIKQHKMESAKSLEHPTPAVKDDTSEVLSKISQRLTEDKRFIETLEGDTSISEVKKSTKVAPDIKNFINFFGGFPEVPTSVKDSFQLIKENFLKINTREFQDLETLYYYIACLKMMGVSLPYSSDEIALRLQNFIYEKVFSESAEALPDPLSIFFGTAIFSEFNLLSKNIVDVDKIKSYISQELDDFLPWKLHLNAYSLLTLKILERNGIPVKKYLSLENEIAKFNLKNLEDYYPSIDIFDKLISLKILNQERDNKDLSIEFIAELEENLSPNNAINDNITDTSKFLIVASMLDIDEKINSKISDMVNFIKQEAKLFDKPEGPTNLSWMKDNIGYKLEVRMMYWTLVSLSQFSHL